ncbi:MAG: DMT family transporter [bacterium]
MNPSIGVPRTTTAAIVMLLGATLFFASQDALTKHLIQTLSASQIVAVRFFFFTLFALIYVARRCGIKAAWRSHRPGLQVFRGLLVAGEIIVFAYTIQFLGLAEMHSLFVCFPLIITALSVPLLGETVGWRRWLAVLCGFVGTLIILRPDAAAFNPAAPIALLAAFMFALYNLLTRKVARHDSFETSLLYMGVIGFAGSMLLAPFNWRPMTTDAALGLGLISITSIIGHLLLVKALELAPAVVLQPFNYFILVWAIIIGFFVYGEVLDPPTLLGAAIVVTSGVFIARREYRMMRHR